MKPAVCVFALTDSFSSLWESLLRDEQKEMLVARRVEDIPLNGDMKGIVVAAGGAESSVDTLVRRIRASHVSPIAVAGADPGHRVAVAIMQAGASDYFVLPQDVAALRSWLDARLSVPRQAAREPVSLGYDFAGIRGRSPALLLALDRAARVIPQERTTVLITGETGTGKEVLARAIHANGPRARRPFVDVNCAAIPPTLLEAELFGYERGAFTDARQAKPGLFEAAHGGTLFLDEIGELPAELQAKLLKALEGGRIRRLGGVHEHTVDVRVITASNVNLREALRSGRMRLDLYYRLGVVHIHLPPLRERGEDILLLADAFMAKFSAEYSIRRPELGAEARRALLSHSWPGNVRELRNVIERAVVLGDGLLDPESLADDARELSTTEPISLPFPAPMLTIERAAAQATVKRMRGNKTAAAEALGVSRKYLYGLLGDNATHAEHVVAPVRLLS